ncbi:MAG: acyloxyacyl hydrolase [Saprospiraceae bacterium]|nr:acyloxyacyl hydrolase [Saprospiraceae bacterium]
MRLTTFTILLFFALKTTAQTSCSAGVHLGIPIIHETLKEGRKYKPYQLLFYYNFANLLKGKKNDLFIYLEPQLVWVHFSPKDKKEWEFGSNLGLEYRLNVSDKTAIIAAIGSGPHFITVETRQQHRGFIFSDNFTAGLHQKLGDSGTNFDLKFRFRHISNLNFAKPNIGIDSWFVIAGITKELKMEN